MTPSTGDNPVYEMCTRRGRPEKFWGLEKSSGDNPGDSKIPLDLVFLVRESFLRTGQRTPTGAERPSLSPNALGRSEEENGPGPRGGSGFGRSEKPLALGTEPPGDRQPRAQGYRAEAEGAPQLLRRTRSGDAANDGTGNRVSVNGVERSRGRFAGRPGFDSGNGVRFAGHRGRGGTAAGEPAARPGVRRGRVADRPGTPAPRRGSVRRSSAGRGCGRRATGERCRTAAGPGDRIDGRKRASPAEPSGTTGDVMIERRLTPEDRSVVDRSTFWVAPGAAPASAGRGTRGFPFLVTRSLRES